MAPRLEGLEDRRLLAAQVFATALNSPGATISAESIRMDAANNQYITGSFTGTITLGGTTLTSAGANDIFLARVNSNGTVAWARRFGATNIQDGDYGRGVALDSNGNVIVTGFFSGPTDFGGGQVTPVGGRDIFIAKYSSAGNFLWAKTYGGVGIDLGQSVGVDAAGNVYAVGAFQGRINFDGTVLDSVGELDAFLLKLNPSGNLQWAKRMGGIGDDRAFSVAVDAAGNTYTTGIFSVIANMLGTPITSTGATDIFALKADTNGNLVWAKGFGGLSADTGTAIAVDGGGNVYLTGEFIGASKFGPITLQNNANNGTGDAFLLKLDPAGNVAWVKSYGGPSSDASYHVAVDPFGFLYVTGVFSGTANFGGTSLTSQGGFDVFWLKVHPNGNVVDLGRIGSVGDDQAYQVAVQGANNRFTLVGNYGAATNIGGVPMPAASGAFVVGLQNTKPQSDYDALRQSQPAVFRLATAQWYVRGADGRGRLMTTYGSPGLNDIPVVGDFDGDGKADPAFYRDSTAQWFAQLSSQNYAPTLLTPNGFGWAGVDIPVPGDYDGDGITDLAVYRPTTAQWFVRMSGQNNASVLLTPNGFGWPGVDIPAPGDYDGDGRTDPAVYRPTNAQWFAQQSSNNYVGTNLAPNGFGWPGVDIPVPGDYDGSGRTQLAVFRPGTATYFIQQPGATARQVAFGGPNYMDLPVQAAIGALKRFGLLPPGTFGASLSSSPVSASATVTSAGATAALVAVPATALAPVASPFEAAETPLAWSGVANRRLSARPRPR